MFDFHWKQKVLSVTCGRFLPSSHTVSPPLNRTDSRLMSTGIEHMTHKQILTHRPKSSWQSLLRLLRKEQKAWYSLVYVYCCSLLMESRYRDTNRIVIDSLSCWNEVSVCRFTPLICDLIIVHMPRMSDFYLPSVGNNSICHVIVLALYSWIDKLET